MAGPPIPPTPTGIPAPGAPYPQPDAAAAAAATADATAVDGELGFVFSRLDFICCLISLAAAAEDVRLLVLLDVADTACCCCCDSTSDASFGCGATPTTDEWVGSTLTTFGPPAFIAQYELIDDGRLCVASAP